MSLLARDQKSIWHPYTQEKTGGDNIVITRGEGAYLYDEHNKPYLDAVSSWWTNIHGHSHPYIARAIMQQASTLEQVIFAGFTHPRAVELAERLLAKLPKDFSKVFYSDNGSTAVEAAIKMCLQYWSNQGITKTKIICFSDSYHGDTFGAMSVSARGVFTDPFARLLFEVIFVDTPSYYNEAAIVEQFQRIVEQQGTDIAAFIFEPLVMGSGGMKMYSPALLSQLIEIAKEHQILTIADEVMTGFGRTGKLFAIEHLSVVPDIICLSKGISGGFMPFAATITQQYIYDAFYDDDKSKMLFHGHSYTGNPLGCAAGIASLELFELEQTMTKIKMIEASHYAVKTSLEQHALIKEVRITGTILAIEYHTEHISGYMSNIRDRLYNYFLSKQIILRPLGNVLYIMPPYCIAIKDLDRIYREIMAFELGTLPLEFFLAQESCDT
jgi:adenosylmethionine-8-amino-7-oxononanoate aminotransferase